MRPLPTELLMDWEDIGIYRDWSSRRTCNHFCWMGRGSAQEPPCRLICFCHVTSIWWTTCTVFAIWTSFYYWTFKLFIEDFVTVHVRDFILHDSSMGVANCVIGNTFSSIFRPGFSFKGLSSLRITEMIHSYQVWFPWWLPHGTMDPFEGNPL